MPYADINKRKEYHKQYSRKWYKNNKKIHSRRTRLRHRRNYVPHPRSGVFLKNPKLYRKANKLWTRFGLTLEQHNGMLLKQRRRCAICKQMLIRPHTDHCHKTGTVRGLLCQACNLGLGMFKDSKKNLKEAIRYLSK